MAQPPSPTGNSSRNLTPLATNFADPVHVDSIHVTRDPPGAVLTNLPSVANREPEAFILELFANPFVPQVARGVSDEPLLASRRIDQRALQSALRRKFDPRDVLVDAIQMNLIDAVKVLLGTNMFDPNQPDNHGDLLLYEAIRSGHPEMLKCLLDHPQIDPNNAAGLKSTPLIFAVKSGKLDMVRCLLEHSQVNPGGCDQTSGESPLYVAVKNGEFAIADFLLQDPRIEVDPGRKSIDINLCDTVLLAAIRYNRPDMVRLLLAHPGIDADKAGSDGDTPIETALLGESDEIVTALVEHGVLVSTLSDRDGIKIALAVGRTCLNILIAPHALATEEALASASSSIGDVKSKAQSFVERLGASPQEWYVQCCAAMVLASVEYYDLDALADHPELVALFNLQQLCATEVETECRRVAILEALSLWDGGGIDGAAEGSFSILGTAHFRLPKVTAELLKRLGSKDPGTTGEL